MLSRSMLCKAAGAVAAAALMAGAANMAQAQQVTLKMHQFLPAQANVPKLVLQVWADKVEKESGGKIKVQHYPSMQLGGKPPELYSQAVDGIADLVWTLPGYTPGKFPRPEVFELPFMMTNAEATSRAYWDLHEKYMKDNDFKDVHIIGVWVHGPGMFHSKRPITKVADLNGLKVRAPTRTINLLLKDLGATPIGMPVPAVPEALSTGVIEAAVIPWEVVPALKVQELVSNHTEFESAALYTSAFIFAMNKGAYAKLPADLKKVIDANSGQEFSAFAGKTQAGADVPSRQLAVDRKNNIITVPTAEVANWRKAADSVVDNWVKEMSGKGIKAKELVEEARALIAKYTK